VAVVGYAAAGIGGGLLAALVAFDPSFIFILVGAERFDRLRRNAGVRAFLDGARPAAIGAILGSAIPLASALKELWQFAILVAAGVVILGLQRHRHHHPGRRRRGSDRAVGGRSPPGQPRLLNTAARGCRNEN